MLRGSGRDRRARAGVAWTAPSTRRGDIVISTGSTPFIPPIDGPARARRRLDQPRGHRPDRGPPPAARAGRRAGRRRDGPGRRAHGRRGGARRGHGPRAAARARAARRGARPRRSTPTASSSASASTRRPCAARAASSCSSSPSATSCAATGCWSRPGGGRASTGSGSRTSASSRGPRGIEVDERMSAGEGIWAIGDVTGIWPLTYVGKYQGRVAAANILGARARGELRRRAEGRLHRPAGRVGRRARRAR